MDKIFRWWPHVNFRTRLVSIAILAISIAMSSAAFSLLIDVQIELLDTYTRFCRDFTLVLAHDITFLIQKKNPEELKDFIEKLYLSTSSIHYIRLFDNYGDLLFSFPMQSKLFQKEFDLCDLTSPLSSNSCDCFSRIPFVSSSINLNYGIINTVLPLQQEDNTLGCLQIGLSSNSNVLHSIKIVQNFSVVIFVLVWLMFILGATFNFLIIAEPIGELFTGLQGISSGNFSQSISSSFKGEIGNLINSFNEMSKRLLCYEKRNVTQLISEKAKLEAVVSTIADGVMLLDAELRLLFVNNVAIKVFHWSNKDLVGKIIFQYLPMHVNEALLPVLNSMIKSNCLDNKALHAQELHVDLYCGSLKTFRFLLSTVLTQKGQGLNGLVVTIQDVTRETQLNEAKNRFISNVSHELRTPLCNIRSFLETLIDYSYKLTESQKSQFLSISYAETQRLNSLVNDVLDLSRLESEYNYVLSPVVLVNTVHCIIQASQIIALNKKVQVAIEIHRQLEKILAHESSLCQILSNLISNSLKFTHQDGRIIVRVYPLLIRVENSVSRKRQATIARLEIIDEGIGIDKIYLRQIFDRFMRIENNIHTLEGTGLGLAIVKSIVEKHNSVVSVYSQAGVGTSFWFDLFIAH